MYVEELSSEHRAQKLAEQEKADAAKMQEVCSAVYTVCMDTVYPVTVDSVCACHSTLCTHVHSTPSKCSRSGAANKGRRIALSSARVCVPCTAQKMEHLARRH